MKTKTYTFHQDSGHGWLAVKRSELEQLGVLDKISSYSYTRGMTVYLEEDCDMSVFFRAKGWSSFSDAPIKDGKYCERSPIRSYDRVVI